MLALLSQVRFWTLKDEIVVKDTDFGVFRYHEKKEISDSSYTEGKRSYAEKRGITWLAQNRRPHKLKDSLKELEDQLAAHKVIFSKWQDYNFLQLMLSSGLLINIYVNVFNGDIQKIIYDKYLLGKLISENVSNVIFTKSHLICSYNDNQITLIYFTKPAIKRNGPDKLSRLDPKLQVLELAGPSGRRLERKLSCNISGDMVLIWWRSTRNEVYPWSPLVRDQDRANVHVYSVSGTKAEPLCYYRTEFDPLCVAFSQVQSSVIHSIEQKVSRKGEVTVESCMYEISKARLQRTSVTSIPLQTQVCCLGFSPDQEKLLLGCIDGTLVLFDEGRGITHVAKASFISTMISWHQDGTIVFVGNERSQFQCFDVALSCIKTQLISEDMTPSSLIDLGSYLKTQPTLVQMQWSKKPDVTMYDENFAQTDGMLLLQFERGPLALLRLVGGGGMKGDVHGVGLTPDALVLLYLNFNQVDKAINLLSSLNWDSYGFVCLACLNRIANHLFRLPLTPEREVQLQTALGSFHIPLRPICHATEVEFGDQVRDLTRRFFHHLLRYQLLEKSFRLALDLHDLDLFADLAHCASWLGESALAAAARDKARQITLDRTSSSQSDSSCSGCSLDASSSSTDSDRPRRPPRLPPPLPTPQPATPVGLNSSVRVPGEKQKVKFSDTVTHIIMPEVPPPLPAGQADPGASTAIAIRLERDGPEPRRRNILLDPNQELLDSLPLCLGNKDYLKDFAKSPATHATGVNGNVGYSLNQDISEEEDNGNGTIKVVHFGVV